MSPFEIRLALEELSRLTDLLPRGAPDFGKDTVMNFWGTKVLLGRELKRVKDVCESLAMSRDYFPSIAEFIAAYDGVNLNDAEVGLEVVNKIRAAMRNPTLSAVWELDGKLPDWWLARHEAAEEAIGAMGWKWVNAQGGWWEICNGRYREASEYDWNTWAKQITANYKQVRAFGPEPAPIGIPNQVALGGETTRRLGTATEPPPKEEKAEPRKLNAFISEIRTGSAR